LRHVVDSVAATFQYCLYAGTLIEFVFDVVEQFHHVAGRSDCPKVLVFPKRDPGLFGAGNGIDHCGDDSFNDALQVRLGLERPRNVAQRSRHATRRARPDPAGFC
jgi:hypothetical protein